MQETQAQSLVWEDSTGSGATKPVSYNSSACALEPSNRSYRNLCASGPRSAVREATAERSWSNRTQGSTPTCCNQRNACTADRDPAEPKQINKCERESDPVFSDSVHFSRSVVSNSLQPQGLQHARLPCPSPTPGACSDSRPSSR